MLKTTIAGEHKVSLAPLVINEITIVGSRCGPFAPALDALQERSVSVTPLIEKIYPLREGIEAVAHAGSPGARKILLPLTEFFTNCCKIASAPPSTREADRNF